MKIIGITGGKGGTGKSTIATAIAFELAESSRVLIVDADVDCPNDHLLLNIERKEIKKVYQRVPKWDFDKCTRCGKCGLVCVTKAIVSPVGIKPIFVPTQCNGCGACEIECPVGAIFWDRKVIGTIYKGKSKNISLLSGELKPNEPVSEFVVNALNEIIEEKKNNYDYIIIDTAAGIHCDVIAALENCDLIFSVTEPTPLGTHDLDLILDVLLKLEIDFNIILNRSDLGDKKIVENLAKKYNKKITIEVPYSKEIVDSYATGKRIEEKNIKKLAQKYIKK